METVPPTADVPINFGFSVNGFRSMRGIIQSIQRMAVSEVVARRQGFEELKRILGSGAGTASS